MESIEKAIIPLGLFNEKIDIRLGEIISVKEHPRSNKFFVLEVDFGDQVKTAVTKLTPFLRRDHFVPTTSNGFPPTSTLKWTYEG